ncbi:MAG: hypothetical protein SGPRY_000785 [Prymnesium sp.]
MNSLLGSWTTSSQRRLLVELHLTPCIVSSPPSLCDGLVNSANERLVGTQFTPTEAHQKLEGSGIIYPPQAIDGLVHELGGAQMWRACAALPLDASGVRCPVGGAALTPAFGELCCSFGAVIHAVSPLYSDPNWSRLLHSTFLSSFSTASRAKLHSIAVPLLGSGAKGAPSNEVAAVAASAIADWVDKSAHHSERLRVLRFAVQDEAQADSISAVLGKTMPFKDHASRSQRLPW